MQEFHASLTDLVKTKGKDAKAHVSDPTLRLLDAVNALNLIHVMYKMSFHIDQHPALKTSFDFPRTGDLREKTNLYFETRGKIIPIYRIMSVPEVLVSANILQRCCYQSDTKHCCRNCFICQRLQLSLRAEAFTLRPRIRV